MARTALRKQRQRGAARETSRSPAGPDSNVRLKEFLFSSASYRKKFSCTNNLDRYRGKSGTSGWQTSKQASWLCICDCMVGWLVGWLACWLACWLAGWLAGWMGGWMDGAKSSSKQTGVTGLRILIQCRWNALFSF